MSFFFFFLMKTILRIKILFTSLLSIFVISSLFPHIKLRVQGNASAFLCKLSLHICGVELVRETNT